MLTDIIDVAEKKFGFEFNLRLFLEQLVFLETWKIPTSSFSNPRHTSGAPRLLRSEHSCRQFTPESRALRQIDRKSSWSRAWLRERPAAALPAHIEEPSGLSLGSTPSTTRSHAASARHRSHDRSPRFIGVLTLIAAGWSLNLLAAALGYRPGAA
jgi:hypothetical protein